MRKILLLPAVILSISLFVNVSFSQDASWFDKFTVSSQELYVGDIANIEVELNIKSFDSDKILVKGGIDNVVMRQKLIKLDPKNKKFVINFDWKAMEVGEREAFFMIVNQSSTPIRRTSIDKPIKITKPIKVLENTHLENTLNR